MKYRIPHYYKKFSCIGGVCEDSCCGGWRIAVDRSSMESYRSVPGAFGRRLRQAIDEKSGCFRLRDRKCMLLEKDGFCGIQKRLGADGLCRDCRDYPRHMEDYGDVRELMLSLSCPEAARVILNDEDQGACSTGIRSGEGQREEDLSWLEDARQALICMIKDRSVDWNQRLAMVLAYTHDLQRRADQLSARKMEAATERLTRRYLKKGASAEFAERLKPFRGRGMERMIRMNAWMRQCGTLEPVLAHWEARMNAVCTSLYHAQSEAEYLEKEQAFGQQAVHCEQEWENLAIYFLQTYFLGAVYDRDVFGKGKMIVYSCLIIREWCLMRFSRTGRFSQEDLVAAAYRYSREVENSDANLEKLEVMFAGSRLYELSSMLTVICGCED